MKVLGIDIGTSSVKCLLTEAGEPVVVAKPYRSIGADGLINAFVECLRELNKVCQLGEIESLGLSGQTGTYLMASRDLSNVPLWLPWSQPGREPHLKTILSDYTPERWKHLINMKHPCLASYPLPTMLFLKDTHPELFANSDLLLLQPKDYLCGLLTGECMSDSGSWRGLANARLQTYSAELLDYAGLRCDRLPVLKSSGQINANGAALTDLKAGTPVAVGYNDFYSALIGIGVNCHGGCFDISGTSEHFGVLVDGDVETSLVSSPFMDSYVHYGVTASSGKTLSLARRLFGEDEPAIPKQAPIFLPYLSGERMPVSDVFARGMMIGLTEHTDIEAIKYSMMEGVVFSLCDIYYALGRPGIQQINSTGGPSASPLLGRLKASMFNVPVIAEELTCGSVMGAVKLAYGTWERRTVVHQPQPELTEFLQPRFEFYKRMYGAWRDMAAGMDTEKLFG